MRYFIQQIVFLGVVVLLLGCQLPIVPVKNIAYEVSFKDNGTLYQLKSEYKCHYEDIGMLSARGPKWHIRGDVDPTRFIGVLSDGSRFEVRPMDKDGAFSADPTWKCPDSTKELETAIDVETRRNPSLIEEFTASRSVSSSHRIQVLDSKLRFGGVSVDTFDESLANTNGSPARSGTRYYRIVLTVLPNTDYTAWVGLQKFIHQKHMLWFSKGSEYPYREFGPDDRAFIDHFDGIFDWKSNSAGTHAPRAEGVVNYFGDPDADTWIISRSSSNAASTWVLKPQTRDEVIGGQKSEWFKTKWIVYEGSRIEIDLDTMRVFYDPDRNEIIRFGIEKIGLW